MSDIIVAPETRDLDELAQSLTQWLGEKMPGAQGLRIDNLAYPRGAGQSHETILFDAHWSEDGAARSQGFVVRIKPGNFTVFPDNLFDEQYNVMKVLHDGGYVRVARPMWLENDPTVIGKPFFVMEKVTGRVPVSIPPYAKTGWVFESSPEQRRKMWEGAVRQLAAVQLVPLSEVGFLGGPDHAPHGLEQEWDKYMRFIDWVKDDPRTPIVQKGADRLKSLWPKNQPEGMVWGDARMGNMMFDDDYNVVAVMDWEQPSLGGALQDLAWFTTISDTMHGPKSSYGAPLEGMGSREETIALWEELTGKSAADLEWYEDFTQLKMTLTGIRLSNLRGVEMINADYIAERLKVA